MPTISEIEAARAAAGARYEAALLELRASVIELGAYDLALTNVHMPTSREVRTLAMQSFAGSPDDLRPGAVHTEFGVDMSGSWSKAVNARADQIIASLG